MELNEYILCCSSANVFRWMFAQLFCAPMGDILYTQVTVINSNLFTGL